MWGFHTNQMKRLVGQGHPQMKKMSKRLLQTLVKSTDGIFASIFWRWVVQTMGHNRAVCGARTFQQHRRWRRRWLSLSRSAGNTHRTCSKTTHLVIRLKGSEQAKDFIASRFVNPSRLLSFRRQFTFACRAHFSEKPSGR